MSNTLAEILSTKTKRVKSDDDFYKRCFAKNSESYKRQIKSSLSNFHCWLNIGEYNLETFLIQMKGLEDESVREEKLVDIVNTYLGYISSEHTCSYCRGKEKPPKSNWSFKINHGKCHVCQGKGIMKAVKPSTVKGALTHLKKYLGYYGFPEVFSKAFTQQIDLPKIVEEQAEPLTNEMFDELLEHTRLDDRRLYLKTNKLTGMRPRETCQLTENNYEPISVNYEKMDKPERWSDLKTNPNFRRLRIVLKSNMTKTGKARHTWVSNQIVDQMLDLLDEKDGQLLFTDNPDSEKAVHNVSTWFRKARERIGQNNPKWIERYDDGKGEYKYKIYSLRAKFITDCMKADPSGNSGHMFAGHIKYMQVYERFTIEESCKLYDKCEEGLRGNIPTSKGAETEVSELREDKMKLELELHNQRQEQISQIQELVQQAEQNRLDDMANFEIKFAESQISTPKKKSG